MKTVRLAIVTLSLVLAFPLFAADPRDAPETPIEEQMQRMNHAFRRLKRDVVDPEKNLESLGLARAIEAGARAAAKFEPALTADKPEAGRAEFVAAFHRRMQEFVAEVIRLEEALQAGRNTEAMERVAKLGELQKAGHRDFRKPDEPERRP